MKNLHPAKPTIPPDRTLDKSAQYYSSCKQAPTDGLFPGNHTRHNNPSLSVGSASLHRIQLATGKRPAHYPTAEFQSAS